MLRSILSHLKRARLVAAAAVIGSATLLVAATPYGAPLCETAAEWVAQNHESLPTSLPEIERYHPVLRRAIFNALSPSQRESLWRAHFTRWIESDNRLSEEQKAFVESVMQRLPLYFEPTSGKAVMVEDRLEERIRETFELDLGREVFATLGSTAYAADQPISVRETNIFGFSPLEFSKKGGPTDGTAADCSCSHGSDWCAAGMYCNASPCTPTESGCGTIFIWPCTGDCKLDM